MSDQAKPAHWLKWLSIVVLLIAGVVGLGVSLCGGFFLLASFTSGSGGGMQGIAPIAAVALAVGLAVLVVSMRQLVSVWREPDDAGQRLPGAVKRAAVLTTIDFLLSGMWFFLPLIISLLRRRRWARQLIAAVLAIKWLTAAGVFLQSYGGVFGLIGFGAIYVALDALVLVALFSGPVTQWFAEERRER